ncbi:flavin-dependent dehydrogenase [Flavobacterium nitrogenifigens]|uniref:Flavin-dependent dehydrogenase n=2 Tax=Flavobacterium TaxID=237 RepID=A0A7W7N8Q0_9FLAO|nr:MULTISPECIES: NAD(P)/FAD-dependent oxidoreductase [Flavobacterium]MBB4802681.1 flavin-dependent dehydrogenase [Flavobacterium nitrogenifigens]MBB6387639.1 flavin-dependent dehydrogenase [Flavobacterium notoginsengisoli]
MGKNPDVVIIGGGLAGLASAIHLSREGLKVVLLEKNDYPKHKVCGEYISNEILPYLKWLGADVAVLNPSQITQFEFTTQKGKRAQTQLPLGGFGISRYILDHFLFENAIKNGCIIINENVTDVSFENDVFTVKTSEKILSAKIVLGAYGKRSNIDQQLSRKFITKKSPWLAVKGHYYGNFDSNLVALHNFHGGYCGVSTVENNIINICYLADYETFKNYKNIEDYQKAVLYKNKNLKDIFENSTPLFDKPLTISQISFDKKLPVENHILMIGDTAGLIHPMCGNGMAMAIHSAKIASELITEFYNGNIVSRDALERKYATEWKKQFRKRLLFGRILAKVLTYKNFTQLITSIAASVPSLLSTIIKQTHGNPVSIN